jgi:hypothetical protein
MPNYKPKVPDLNATELSKSRDTLYANRSKFTPEAYQEAQNTLGPMEHSKFVEGEFQKDKPISGISSALLSPIWTGFKLTNAGLRGMGYTEKDFPTINKHLSDTFGEKLGQEDWSQPSVGEIGQAFKGAGSGFLDWLSRKMGNY